MTPDPMPTTELRRLADGPAAAVPTMAALDWYTERCVALVELRHPALAELVLRAREAELRDPDELED